LDEVDSFVADRIWDYCGRVPLGTRIANDVFRFELLSADYRGAAAERESGRPCGSVWWSGEPDGIWAARGGDGAVAGDDVVRGNVYDLRPGAGCAGGSRRGLGRVDFAEIFEACACSDEDCAGHAGTEHATACGAAIDSTAAGSGCTEEVAGDPGIIWKARLKP
jgi:hypothetical protein